jgi:hypothetical protein
MRAPLLSRHRRTLSSIWHQTPVVARICLYAWIGIGVLGLGRMATMTQAALHAAATGGLEKRAEIWSPIYGFAAACAPHLIPGGSILLVDPADQLPPLLRYRSPALWNVDTINLTTYTYALYPHPVTPLADVPPDWSPAGESVDYIALWEQRIQRSPARQAMAREAEQTLRQALPGRQICAYSGAGGGRGLVFARSTRAASTLAAPVKAASLGKDAASAAQPDSFVNTVAAYGLVLLGLATLWLIGALALLSIAGAALATRVVAALALPLGCVGITIEMLVYSIFGIRWSLAGLIVPWLALAGLQLWWHRDALTLSRVRRAWRAMLARPRWLLALDERVALVTLAAVATGAWVLAPFQLPYWDGLSFYYFRAKAFFTDLSITPYYQHAPALPFTVPAHPPLVALSVTWLYLFMGKVDEQPSLLLWPALFITLLAGFYLLARSKVSRRMALWLTLGLALVSAIVPQSVTAPYPTHVFGMLLTSAMVGGYADLPLAILLLFGCGLLWHWAASERKTRRMLIVAGCFLAGAALTKEEGTTAMLIALAASPLLTAWGAREAALARRTGWWWALVCSGIPCVAVVLPWLFVRFYYPMPDFSIATAGHSPAMVLERVVLVTIYFGARLVAFSPALLILLGAWIIERRHQHTPLVLGASGRWWYLACVVLALLAVDALVEVGVTSSPGEVITLVASNNARFILQLTPLIFLVALAAWCDLLTRRVDHERVLPDAKHPVLEPAPLR